METLIRVGQEHGVSLKRNPDCGAIPDAVEAASNIVISDSVRDDDQVEAREGHVICHIVDLPFAKPPFGVTRTKFPEDQETYLDVANVKCAIYPSKADQITRLEAVLDALAEVPVEQRDCPKARPAPVTLERLIDAAEAQGLRLLPDARCIEPGVVAQASTIVPYDPPENYDQVWRDEGEVTCLIRAAAAPGGEEIRRTKLSSGTRFEFLNVSCTVFPHPQEEKIQVERLRATLEELGKPTPSNPSNGGTTTGDDGAESPTTV